MITDEAASRPSTSSRPASPPSTSLREGAIGVLGTDATPLHEYEPGTWGPDEADQLIGEDGPWSEPS